MRVRTWVLIFLVSQLLGCAAAPRVCPPSDASDGTGATLVVYWPQDRALDLAFVKIALDGCIAGELQKGHYLLNRVRAGEHAVGAVNYPGEMGGEGEISVDPRDDDILYLRFRRKVISPFDVQGIFDVTDRATALRLMPALAAMVR